MTVGLQRRAGVRPLVGQVQDGVRHCLLFLLLIIVTLMAACRETSSTSGATPQPASAWRKIEPGGETTCAHGTPYAFWVRSGTRNKLLVYFQGGGGCWSAQTCQPGSPSYDATVTYRDSPEIRENGLLDFRHPDNPFIDYHVVYIPYCTGDLHWGKNSQPYSFSGHKFIVQHKGFVNASAALSWVYEHFSSLESIFVTGWSAGSVGSILFAPYLIEHYPQARVTQLGDSLSFTFSQPANLQRSFCAHDNFPSWIPALAHLQPEEFTMARFYIAVANHYPEYTFSQLNTAYDHSQERYFQLFGGAVGGFRSALQTSLHSIHSQAPNFRFYTAPGWDHCVLPYRRFYSVETEGIRLRDWVARLANHQKVPNVQCTKCDAPRIWHSSPAHPQQ